MIKKKTFLNILFFLFFLGFTTNMYCQVLKSQAYRIEYLGIISSDIDQNMSKLTGDLYYSQLNEIPTFLVIDKRSDFLMMKTPESSVFSNTNLTFFTEIKKSEDSDKWITVFHVINPVEKSENTKSCEYDSFYKILMESRTTLKETLKSLVTNEPQEQKDNSLDATVNNLLSKNHIASTEILSGTWTGENYIDKIIIMRGGRGFVIFNNGATMTIVITLETENNQQKVLIKQNGHANASYYPNLPRTIAMKAALSAEPLEWTLYLTDDNTLSGTKKTLTEAGESFEYTTENVKWERTR